ncbi:MAG TPA: hypothetical protein VGD24_02375 [Gallionella sp.]
MHFLKRPFTHLRHLICMLLLVGVPLEASAQMYKCMTEGGVYSFQDAPCEAPVHDKSSDPVAGTVTALPPVVMDPDEIAYQMKSRPDTEQVSGTSNKSALLIFAVVVIYVGLAAFQGWWASMRNRSFWKWFLFSALVNPLLVMIIFRFRGKDPGAPKPAR